VAAHGNGPFAPACEPTHVLTAIVQDNLGPGRENIVPPGLKEARDARVDLDCRTEINGRSLFSAKQNPRRRRGSR
jgi:hypothetical protein